MTLNFISNPFQRYYLKFIEFVWFWRLDCHRAFFSSNMNIWVEPSLRNCWIMKTTKNEKKSSSPRIHIFSIPPNTHFIKRPRNSRTVNRNYARIHCRVGVVYKKVRFHRLQCWFLKVCPSCVGLNEWFEPCLFLR